jgi:cell wall-associated NlpC family hydrolase
MRAFGATLLSMAITAAAAAPALGATHTAPTGGVAPTATSSPAPASSTPAAPPNAAPIVAHSSSLAYHGPVFEKTATGQIVPYVAASASPSASASATVSTGGSAVPVSVAPTAPTKPELLVPGTRAKVINGQAAAPMSAPASVQAMIWQANKIIGLPYIFGGGHASFTARGYDCSGTVSFALHGADLLSTPEDSSEFESWGGGGIGQWVTIFANAGHAYMDIAGIRLDTSAADDPSDQQGPRWRPLRHANSGYTVRHPVSL